MLRRTLVPLLALGAVACAISPVGSGFDDDDGGAGQPATFHDAVANPSKDTGAAPEASPAADASEDAASDAPPGADATAPPDAGSDATVAADAGSDATVAKDAGGDGGPDATVADAAKEAGPDATVADGGRDAASDAVAAADVVDAKVVDAPPDGPPSPTVDGWTFQGTQFTPGSVGCLYSSSEWFMDGSISANEYLLFSFLTKPVAGSYSATDTLFLSASEVRISLKHSGQFWFSTSGTMTVQLVSGRIRAVTVNAIVENSDTLATTPIVARLTCP